MTDTAIQQANHAYNKQVSDQITRVTAELRRMEHLLSAGMVDRRVLSEFRYAVDRVRTTGWQVERWLDGDERALSVMILEDRVRLTAQLAAQLASEPAIAGTGCNGLPELKQAITRLGSVLENR